jgi:outer membrane protein assembly factor BamB
MKKQSHTVFFPISNSVQAKLFASVLLCCSVFLFLPLFGGAGKVMAAPGWSAKLDGRVRFYQATELGVLIVGTEKSLYAVDTETGDVIWRRRKVHLDETDVAPVPGTDIVLLSLEDGSKTRLDAADLITGNSVWRSDKVRGAVMQMAFDRNSNMLAVVLVRDAKGSAREGFKRKPVVHMLDLGTGAEAWKYELESDVEMMPTHWSEDNSDDKVPYTLDNYRPPVFLDGRLYLFYEGLTSLDARTGRERRREKFRINEEGLALTESDPVADESAVYTSGHGRVRAISRLNGEVAWETKDLGTVPEMILTRKVLYARTGGQFTHLKDGETVERGPYGVSAIDIESGKILWRYKGADKGITNIVLPNPSTILLADRDDLIVLDSDTGKRRTKISHGVERAAFVLVNERGEAVVGGRNEIAAFDVTTVRNVWRSHHNPPGRGVFRTVAAIAARASSLYFRYGGTATAAFRGVQLLNAVNSVRWSGIAAHVSLPSLTSLATEYSREYARDRISTFGVLSRVQRQRTYSPTISVPRPSIDVEDRLMDRLDPAHQLERLSRFLWNRQRLAALRGQWMYFYTDLNSGNGLLGVNVNTGRPERAIRMGAPDERFISDEVSNLLYVSQGERLVAYSLDERISADGY